MKHAKVSKTAILISSVLVGIFLYSVIFLFIQSEERGIEEFSSEDYQRIALEMELKNNMLAFDKVDNATAIVSTCDSEIDFINIFLVTSDKISDLEINNMKSLLLAKFEGLKEDNIEIEYSVW